MNKLNLSGVGPTPKRPLTEEEIGKAYLESMIMLPAVLQQLLEAIGSVADSVSVLALYAEKKGLKEELFTETDLSGGDDAE